jgi:hypothetical protein
VSNERIALAVRGDWIKLDLELDFPPGNAAAPLVQPAAEELWLASRVLALVSNYHAGRAARRTPLEQMTTPTDEHARALGYLEELNPVTSDEDLALALDPDAVEELEELLDEGGTIADDAADELSFEHDEDQADDDALEPDEDTGPPPGQDISAAVFDALRKTAPLAADRPTERDVMLACNRLTALERLHPSTALARELGIPANRVAPYIRMARARSWLPQVTNLAGEEVGA